MKKKYAICSLIFLLGLILVFGANQLNAASRSISLVQGWNWVSFNVLPVDLSLDSVFADILGQVEQVRSQTQSAIRLNGNWIGDLGDMSGIRQGLMYKVQVSEACSLNVAGTTIPVGKPIQLITGWNWTAYFPESLQPPSQALSNIDSQLLQAKSQTESVVHTGGQWLGDLQQMSHGRGYTLRVDNPATLIYPLANKDRWVVVHHPSYQWSQLNGIGIPWDKITHLALDGMLPQQVSANEWTIVPWNWVSLQTWNQGSQAMITEGHAAGKIVYCMLGGAGSNTGNNSGIWNAATSEANVVLFAQNIATVLKNAGFDGADLDWEQGIDYDGFLRLARELRKAWPEALITVPTASFGRDADEFAPIAEYVDAFLPMTYIPVSQWGGWIIPVPLTPLFRYSTNPYSVNNVLNDWINEGIPLSKMAMGVGGFGEVWGDRNGDGRAPTAPYVSAPNGLAEGESGCQYSDNRVTQLWVNQTVAAHPEMTENWDDVGKCTYWSAPAPDQLVRAQIGSGSVMIDVGVIFYESPRSIQEKVNYIYNYGLKGMMFWTLAQMRDGSGGFPNLDVAKQLHLDQ